MSKIKCSVCDLLNKVGLLSSELHRYRCFDTPCSAVHVPDF